MWYLFLCGPEMSSPSPPPTAAPSVLQSRPDGAGRGPRMLAAPVGRSMIARGIMLQAGPDRSLSVWFLVFLRGVSAECAAPADALTDPAHARSSCGLQYDRTRHSSFKHVAIAHASLVDNVRERQTAAKPSLTTRRGSLLLSNFDRPAAY